MEGHPYGWWSLLPPLTALVLAIFTRRVILSLLIAVLAGAWVMEPAAWWSPAKYVGAISNAVTNHLWVTLTDQEKLYIFAFTMLMGAMVGIIRRGGGMNGLVQVTQRWANNRRKGQLLTWFLGLFIFFDDYANTILLGNTLRPLCDRLKISRAKLAYLVDSTAAPVAGLALVSTWVAGEIGYVRDGIDKIPEAAGWKPFDLFLYSLPYRFYVLWALLFVPMIAWLGRDFGPMRKAEREALSSSPPDPDSPGEQTAAPKPSTPAKWYNAVIPVAVTVVAITWFLYSSGRSAVAAEKNPTLQDIIGNADAYGSLLWGALWGVLAAVILIWPQRILTGAQITSAAAAGAQMVVPALAILWLASTISAMTGNKPSREDRESELIRQAEAIGSVQARLTKDAWPLAAQGARIDPLAVELAQAGVSTKEAWRIFTEAGRSAEETAKALLAAGASPGEVLRAASAENNAQQNNAQQNNAQLKEVENVLAVSEDRHQVLSDQNTYPYKRYRLYTGVFLGELLKGRLPAWLFPTLVFLLSSFIAFATGTSWGTMGIIMPLTIPLAHQILSQEGAVDPHHPVMLCSIGSVLAGAIFGDHCSPISDTTVLSSQASGCDHLLHVWTQLPYALFVGGVAAVLGCLPIGLGVSVWIMLPVGVVVMLAGLRLFGKPVDV